MTRSQQQTLVHLRDAGALGTSALNFQQWSDLYALREMGLVKLAGTDAFGVWRPARDVWGDAR